MDGAQNCMLPTVCIETTCVCVCSKHRALRLVHGPHEGLLLERAACIRATTTLFDTEVGRDLYMTEQPVEEFALQSICSAPPSLRFAQLSDMGGPEPDAAPPELRMPLTKTTRNVASAKSSEAWGAANGGVTT